MEKENNIIKKQIFCVFFSVYYVEKLKKKMHSNNPIWGNEKTSRETCTSKP